MAVTKAKKKVVKKVSHGIAHVVATNNNTRITITDPTGAVLTWATAGANNFKGAKKSTPYAATVVADAVGKKVAEMGMKTVDVLMRGIGQGRESCVIVYYVFIKKSAKMADFFYNKTNRFVACVVQKSWKK